MAPVVGIDLGTSNSCVAAYIEGKHQVIADDQGQKLTPSVVAFGKDKKILIGADAKGQMFTNPKRTITSVKRLLGKKIISPEVKKAQALLPYKIVQGDDQAVAIDIDGQHYSPQEISSLILRHLKSLATQHFKQEITQAVVTIPAHFNDSQRQATKDACKIAGIEVLRMVNEPTAAALAYGFGKGLAETVAIYDLGGGTFDISILKLENQVFEVLATAGDTFLGGDDFDDRIIDLCAEDFLQKTKIDLRQLSAALPLLRTNAERAKRKLSYAEKTDIYIPGIYSENGQNLDFQYTLTRENFFKATEPLIQKTFSVCDEALNAAGLKASDLDAVILVGGPTKMSLIYDVVGTYFGKSPLRELNPDEVVAIGASIQASSLSGESSAKSSPSALLLDVTPLDLGVATVGGYTETIIEANSPIPAQAAKIFTTISDNQEMVLIKIYQGKNRREEDSHLLGHFEFSGFKKGRAGDISLEVIFNINTDGIVDVRARDTVTGQEQNLQVRLTATMSSTDLNSVMERADEHKQVRLKRAFPNAKRIVLCLSSSKGPRYEEGIVESLDPLATTIDFVPEADHSQKKSVDRKDLCWILEVEDFANTPRYIQALENQPHQSHADLHRLRFKHGGTIFGLVAQAALRDEGFWVRPFTESQMPGKLFAYSGALHEISPLG